MKINLKRRKKGKKENLSDEDQRRRRRSLVDDPVKKLAPIRALVIAARASLRRDRERRSKLLSSMNLLASTIDLRPYILDGSKPREPSPARLQPRSPPARLLLVKVKTSSIH